METAKEKLEKMTAAATEPLLSEAELDELLAGAGKADAAGLIPGSEDWVPTYDLNKAAANGWLIKAGRASALVEADPPGSGIYTSKVFENCMAMARVYKARSNAAIKY